ncbi:MAG: hypothetical protein IPM24_19560 [Bryobacterales bacterium]|nr:hypothetical protein [Bryobacterales bacterium]
MNRRHFLTGLPVLGAAATAGCEQSPARKPVQVAAVVTEYRWYSHADVVCGRLLGGYSANGVWSPPRTRLVSLYRAQTPSNDMSRDLSARHGFQTYPTIREALTLGGPKLAVDAVVFIGEHGQYPFNDVGQHLYPRFELFSEVLDVYESNGSGVPTFFDKHLSYDWKKASALFNRVRKLGFPFMAGSSVTVTIRKPDLQIPLELPITEAVCIGHGPLDAYGFHLLEAMQCMVERRKGGETGVREVEMLEGDAIWAWLAGPGEWAMPLLESARELDPNRETVPLRSQAKDPALFRIEYRDGLRAVALMLTPSGNGRIVALRARRVSTTLRHQAREFTDFFPLSPAVC